MHFFCRLKSFCEAEAFVGYQRDTAAAVVFQATSSHAYEVGNMKGDTDKDTVSTHEHEYSSLKLVIVLLGLEKK